MTRAEIYFLISIILLSALGFHNVYLDLKIKNMENKKCNSK